MDIQEFQSLPDSLEPQELEVLFERVLQMSPNSENEAVLIVRAMAELANRQWHTHELVNPSLGKRIELWLQQHWNPISPHYVANTIFVCGSLGLAGLYDFMVKELQNGNMHPESQTRIEQFIHQRGRTISDPYSGMK